jgi:hypothetical protein
MREGSGMRRLARWLVAATTLAVLGAGSFLAYRLSVNKANDSQHETMMGWQPISGRWTEHAGIFTNSNYGRGDMLVATRPHDANYRISADIRFDLLFAETHYGDAGLVIRTTGPQPGVDSYQGYYAGLRPDSQTVVLGRASYDWHELKTVALSSPITVGAWYHLELTANGCNLTVTAAPVGSSSSAQIDYEDNHCLQTGVAGLRSFYAQASWRNVKINQN